MYTKVLVSEDMQDINKGVYATLCELGITEICQVQYCDDAYLKIKKAALDEEPFQLLITDLSFKTDYRKQKLQSGEDLIKALKSEFPTLPIVVYSIEDRLQKVKSLINDYHVKAHVCKSRSGLVHLKNAIENVFKGKSYLSPEVSKALSKKNNLEIDDFDILLLKKLSKGLSQDEISLYLKQNNISPCSLSTIEKRLNKLRIDFKANNAIHLIATVKDLGLI